MLSLPVMTLLWLVEGAMALENMTVGHSYRLPYRQIGRGKKTKGNVCSKIITKQAFPLVRPRTCFPRGKKNENGAGFFDAQIVY